MDLDPRAGGDLDLVYFVPELVAHLMQELPVGANVDPSRKAGADADPDQLIESGMEERLAALDDHGAEVDMLRQHGDGLLISNGLKEFSLRAG